MYRSLKLAITLTLILTFLSGCFDGCNVELSGYVRSMPDSNAVPGALVIFMSSGKTTDSNGYYEFSRSYSDGDTDPLELQITVTDVDGEINGVFVSEDTLFSVEGVEHIREITIQIDLYVEMVDNTANRLLLAD